MDYNSIKALLAVLLPIGILCFAMAFVRFIFIKEDGSTFVKVGRFFGSATCGIIFGYVDSMFFDIKWALLFSPIITLVGDGAVNWINKRGWAEILIYIKKEIVEYIKTKIGSNTDNTNQDGK